MRLTILLILIALKPCLAQDFSDYFTSALEKIKNCKNTNQAYAIDTLNITQEHLAFESISNKIKIKKSRAYESLATLTVDTSVRNQKATIKLNLTAAIDDKGNKFELSNQVFGLSNAQNSFSFIFNENQLLEIKNNENIKNIVSFEGQLFWIYSPNSNRIEFNKIGETKVVKKTKFKLRYINNDIVLFDVYGEAKDFESTILYKNNLMVEECKTYYFSSNKNEIYKQINQKYNVSIDSEGDSYALVYFTKNYASTITFEEKLPKKVLQKEMIFKVSD